MRYTGFFPSCLLPLASCLLPLFCSLFPVPCSLSYSFTSQLKTQDIKGVSRCYQTKS
ncbi:hypothetical protein BJP36_40530 [Moorena producens JHB]|uniref:Uncharacterized protein n=1 Tax=Moorena producens (strain JHB) TaxID=1454205 RepID=A0A9Q9SS84_MOOP1|nr:hypothetical protein [Moorena producens]WAN68657.1 hypothetical protein BJP36_40530 [Moorena producens JHB]